MLTALVSAIVAPLINGLSAIAGPLIAFFAGRSSGHSAAVAEAQAQVSETLRREAEAVAAAPHTQSETVALLRNPKQEF